MAQIFGFFSILRYMARHFSFAPPAVPMLNLALRRFVFKIWFFPPPPCEMPFPAIGGADYLFPFHFPASQTSW